LTPQSENTKPKKEKQELRTHMLYCRLSEAEYSRVKAETGKQGFSLSAFVRKRIFDAPSLASQQDLETLTKLQRHGRAIKEALEEAGGGYSDSAAQSIKDLSAYVRALAAKRLGVSGDTEAK
jgi:hypothetical protein